MHSKRGISHSKRGILQSEKPQDSAEGLIASFGNNQNIGTLLGVENGATTLEWSGKRMDPGHLKLLGAELGAGRNAKDVQTITMSSNPSILNQYTGTGELGKEDMSGMDAVCANISQVATWNLSDCGLTSSAVLSLTGINWKETNLQSLTLDSTGATDEESSSTYTLLAEDTTINLARKNLGAADIKLVCKWLTVPRVADTATGQFSMEESCFLLQKS